MDSSIQTHPLDSHQHQQQTATDSTTRHQEHMNTNRISKTQTQSQTHGGKGEYTLLLFGPLKTYCGDTSSLTLSAPSNLFRLFQILESKFPGVARRVLRSCQVVVGLEYVDVDVEMVVDAVLSRHAIFNREDHEDGREEGVQDGVEGMDVLIRPGDEVGIVPPVSSG